MIGTFVNTAAILIGSVAGGFLRRGIRREQTNALYTAMGLAALLLGANATINHLPDSSYPVLFIASLAIGAVVGTALDLDRRFKALSGRISGSELAKGLTTGILLYCVGTLSMVGPVMSALYGDNTYLYTNAMLDLVTSAVLASTYGFGMVWAAPVLFLSQGTIYVVALCARDFISEELICEISIVGGALIAASGLGVLNIKDCKPLNLLPALFVPVCFFLLKQFVGW